MYKSKLTKEEQIAARKAYKAKHYQDNKERIRAQRKEQRSQMCTSKKKAKDRHYNFKYHYGITLEEYETLLIQQGNSCAICLKPHGEDGIDRLYVDHCHSTGKIRGLLCFKCNTALGHFNDDAHLVEKALGYITGKTIEEAS